MAVAVLAKSCQLAAGSWQQVSWQPNFEADSRHIPEREDERGSGGRQPEGPIYRPTAEARVGPPSAQQRHGDDDRSRLPVFDY